jgi:hypothetical protein
MSPGSGHGHRVLPRERENGASKDTRVSSAAVALRAVEALLRELEAIDEFSGVVGGRAGRSDAAAGRLRLRRSHLEHSDHGRDPFRHGVDHQAVHGVATLQLEAIDEAVRNV